jgi:hypothetical protein
MLGGCFVLVANITFPALHARMNEGLLFQLSAWACAVSYVITPFIPRVVAAMYPTSSFALRSPLPGADGAAGQFDPQAEEAALNTAIGIVVAVSFLRIVPVDYLFVFNLMRVGDTAPRRFLGVATGLSQSLASVVRMVTPALATPFFALTVQWVATQEATEDAAAAVGGAPPAGTNGSGPLLPFLLTTPLVFIICGAVVLVTALHDAYVQSLRRTPMWARARAVLEAA